MALPAAARAITGLPCKEVTGRLSILDQKRIADGATLFGPSDLTPLMQQSKVWFSRNIDGPTSNALQLVDVRKQKGCGPR